MIDQSYSVNNLIKILALENRKGNYKEQEFFDKARRLDRAIAKRRSRYKEAKPKAHQLRAKYRRRASPALRTQIQKCERLLTILAKQQGRLRNIKRDYLREELERISEVLSARPESPSLEKVDALPDGKVAYRLDTSVTTYFQDKQVQANLKSCFGLNASSRDAIVDQVISALSDKFPKVIVRTDIKNFYESLSHERIRSSIGKHIALDPSSRRFVFDVIDKYKALSGERRGVPRGVGVSSLIAEIYMLDLDREIRERDDVLYYSRYVDDVFVVFNNSGLRKSKSECKDIVRRSASEVSLELNETKTDIFCPPSEEKKLQFLGYEIHSRSNGKKPLVGVSKKRMNRYKKRIDLAFSDYKYNAMFDEKKARRLLLDRMRFLTSNTHLYNNKRDAMVGVYFANRHVSRLRDFEALDRFLLSRSRTVNDPSLKRKLRRYSFLTGFETKQYTKFSTRKISSIVKVWKYVS